MLMVDTEKCFKQKLYDIQVAAFKLKQPNILKTMYFMKKCFRQKLFYFKGERELH